MLDFTKYKRIFTFGCSFTNYVYPTWANIIFSEAHNAEHHNLGRAGAGNLYITCKIAEANQRFKFNEHDLVMVMYSTFYREDRYINGTWHCYGNVFNQDYYDKNFVRKYVDIDGCLVRDLALISSTNTLLELLPCDSFIMMSSDKMNEANINTDRTLPDRSSRIVDVYKNIIDKLPSTMNTMIKSYSGFIEQQTKDGTRFIDNHPSPIAYYNYLNYVGIPLTVKAKKYAEDAMEKLAPYIMEPNNTKHKVYTQEVYEYLFPELNTTSRINGIMF